VHKPLDVTVLGVTAGTQVFTGRCVVGLAVITAAAAAAELSVYDGTSAADPRRIHIKAPVEATEGIAGGRIWFNTGVFVVTTGAGSDSQIGIE
jgi:hypothetical protein